MFDVAAEDAFFHFGEGDTTDRKLVWTPTKPSGVQQHIRKRYLDLQYRDRDKDMRSQYRSKKFTSWWWHASRQRL